MFEKAPKIIYTLMNMNPLAIIITSYRDVFYWGLTPNLKSLLILLLFSLVLVSLGLFIFRKLSKGFAEEI